MLESALRDETGGCAPARLLKPERPNPGDAVMKKQTVNKVKNIRVKTGMKAGFLGKI